MPISYVLDTTRRRVKVTIRGAVTVEEFTAALDRQVADGLWPYARVIDLAGADPPVLAADMQAFIAHMRRLVEWHGPRGPVAIVAPGHTAFQAARLYRHFSGRPDRLVDIFWSLSEAETWLEGLSDAVSGPEAETDSVGRLPPLPSGSDGTGSGV